MDYKSWRLKCCDMKIQFYLHLNGIDQWNWANEVNEKKKTTNTLANMLQPTHQRAHLPIQQCFFRICTGFATLHKQKPTTTSTHQSTGQLTKMCKIFSSSSSCSTSSDIFFSCIQFVSSSALWHLLLSSIICHLNNS